MNADLSDSKVRVLNRPIAASKVALSVKPTTDLNRIRSTETIHILYEKINIAFAFQSLVHLCFFVIEESFPCQ